ncbi:MAG: Maf family protein [Kiritimatiellia bacterium]
MQPIVLASASPRRSAILAKMGAAFSLSPVDCNEVRLPDPVETCATNAQLKWAAAKDIHPNRWILAADTIVSFEGQTYGKPSGREDAIRMLLSFSGKPQHVFTAVCLSTPEQREPDLFIETSALYFKTLSRTDVEHYLDLAHTLDRAGAYDIGTHGEQIISRLVGSQTNVEGLPGHIVEQWLRSHAYPLFASRS